MTIKNDLLCLIEDYEYSFKDMIHKGYCLIYYSGFVMGILIGYWLLPKLIGGYGYIGLP